ncbi:MAG TPA: hypothetical protein P5311_00080 [Candidatus Dojkabacteria bacterium]|nr:hypothetical protein [Candidatus Dojkabacteria bacterium]
MSNSNTNNGGDFEVSNYLVTEGVNPKKIDPIQQGMDLSLLSKAEEKQQNRPSIPKGRGSPKIRKAVSSLRLSNPFRGI